MFSLSYRDPSTNRTFVRAVESEFGSTHLGDWSGYAGDECMWTWDRRTKHYGQSNAVSLVNGYRLYGSQQSGRSLRSLSAIRQKANEVSGLIAERY